MLPARSILPKILLPLGIAILLQLVLCALSFFPQQQQTPPTTRAKLDRLIFCLDEARRDLEANDKPQAEADLRQYTELVNAFLPDKSGDAKQSGSPGSSAYLLTILTIACIGASTIILFKATKRIDQMMSEADRQKEDYLAMIAHDLRTPISSIAGALTALADSADNRIPAKSMEIITRTQANASRLIDLINDLLNLESIQAGKIQLHKERVPLAYVFECALETMDPLAKQHDVKLSIPETDIDVIADGNRLVQVMINLISNAVRYSPAGEVVTITLSRNSRQETEVRVSDRGPGIPPEKVATIFDKFEQAQQVTLNSWGLGLAICKEIVALHGGTIGVDTQTGSGTTFWFRLPAESADVVKAIT